MVDFRIDVVIDPKGATIGRTVVERELVVIENRANQTRAAVGGMLTALVTAGAAAAAIRTLSTFEQSLATVRAVTGATAEQFELLRRKAIELGISTRFTATEAGDALLSLSRAGFSVQEALAAVGGTLTLARAGGLGLAEATDIAASALRGFRLEAEQTGRVVDVLTLAANSANTTVGQLGEGLKFVAPVATGLGVSIEATNAALGVLSDAGLKASLAGTGLRRVLAELESPTKENRDLLRSLGLSADDVRVSQIGLVQALGLLKEAGLDTGAALEFFGDRGGPAFEVLSNNLGRIEEFTKRLEGAGGTAQRTAAVIDDNLQGAILRAKSALEGLILSLGNAGGTNALTAGFDKAATALRTLADQTNTATAGVTILAAALSTKLIPGMGRLLTVSVAANPLLATLAATGTLVAIAFARVADEFETVNRNLNMLAEDAKFASQGAQIRGLTRELNELEKAGKRQGQLSEGQAARADFLRARLGELSKQIRQEAEDERRLREAREASTVSVENSLAALDRRIARQKLSSRETEVQSRLEEELNRLLDAGIVASDSQRSDIEGRLRKIQALEDEKSTLEDLRSTQEEAARRQVALNSLYAAGTITAEEYRTAIAKLGSATEETLGRDPYKEAIQSLRDAITIEQTRLRQGELAATAIETELALRRQGVELTREQQNELASLLFAQTKLTEEQERAAESRRTAEEDARRREQLIAELDIGAQLLQQEADLLALRATRPDLEAAIAVALDNVRLRALESSTALEDGFSRAFIKIRREAENLSAVGESVVTSFADNATDAITEFARKGELDIKKFTQAFLDDLARILARLLVVQAINAALGGVGIPTAAPPVPAGAFADGGTTQPGRSYLVGERGPELFTPGQTGSVAPIAAASAAPPQVNVQVVNVTDPNEVPAAINNGGADEAIINALSRNPERVRQVIQ
jgi:TP901 family phage tail tape measure protein/lambda family phage tail tape measure protein